jgi:hypothetical protein
MQKKVARRRRREQAKGRNKRIAIYDVKLFILHSSLRVKTNINFTC